MNKKKTIAVAIVLALILLIGGMLAFFTDTHEVTNKFTLGNGVDIEVTETFNEENAKDLLPGAVVAKAPSIENKSSTTDAYVFVKVTVPTYTKNSSTTELFKYDVNTGWTEIESLATEDTTAKTKTHVYAYGTTTAMTKLEKSQTTTKPIFDEVTLEPTLTEAEKETASVTPNIIVKGYGIQTTDLGKTDPAEIFALFGNN